MSTAPKLNTLGLPNEFVHSFECSFDISGLFTNVSLDEAMNIYRNKDSFLIELTIFKSSAYFCEDLFNVSS